MRIRISIPLVIIACLLIAAPTTWAASIGVNFIGRGAGAGAILLPTESAGLFPQSLWNNIDSGDPVVDGSSPPLVDSADNFTSVKVIYDANDSWNSDGGTATPDEKLMKGIIKANPDPDLTPANNTDRMVFVITNLQVGATYNIIVYTTANGPFAEMNLTIGSTTYYIGEQNSFTAGGGVFIEATSTTPGSYVEANYGGFTNVAPAANGTVTITAVKNITDPQFNDGIGVAGIQIFQASGVFPPNTETASITTNPQDAATMVGGTVTFTVGTQGPRKIQWTKNNVPISGATGTTYSFTPVLADNGAQIRAIVYNNVNTNTSTAATLFVGTPTLTQGFLTAERWTGMGGTAVQPIKDAIANSTAPNSMFFVSGPNIPQTAPDINDFGVRVSGWLKPDVTGWYDFFTRSDDASQVFINAVNAGTGTNALPDVTTDLPIAEETGCCEGFKEPIRPDAGGFQPYETTTEPIFLEAGKLYGFVALYKEGGGGDFLQVAWRLTNSTTAASALAPISLANCFTLASAAGQQASITAPGSTSVQEGRTASFNATVTTLPTAGLFGIQWLKNGTPIPGATGTQYTTPLLTLADNNAQFQAIAYTLTGILTSSPPAVLTVIPDTFPPIPSAGAIATVSGAVQVGIGFDEAVNQADLVPANFTVIGATTATARFPTNSFGDYSAVIIDTTGLVPGNTYTARVSNVRDVKGNAISSTGVNAAFTVPSNMGWADTGLHKRPGQVVPVGANGFDVLNGGRTEWSTYDEATIAYTKKTNDFDVRVQVVYAEPGSQWTRTGLMARNALNAGEPSSDGAGQGTNASAYAQTHVNPSQTVWSSGRGPAGATPANPNPNNGHEQNQRLSAGAQTGGWGNAGTSPTYPNTWLRLRRTGASLQGFRSMDGVNWTAQGSTTLTDQQAEMFVGPFLAIETGNIWSGVDHNVWTSPFNPTFDRLFVAQFRNFGDILAVLPAPTLSVSRSGGNIIITYTGVLQSAPIVTGTYTDVVGATSPYTTPTTGPERYYRARN